MTETALAMLRRLLVDRCDELRTRLTRRLGSANIASDAMHEVWLKLARVESIGAIRSPSNYLFGIALNAARDQSLTAMRLPASGPSGAPATSAIRANAPNGLSVAAGTVPGNRA
jgi:DNA-directed RNA polymerase specialized sigma24 family protein